MSKRLLFLNGLAILTIPIHHATAYGLQAMFIWTDRYRPVSVPNFDQLGTPAYYVTIALRQLDTYSVPAFLFISGFFVAFMVRGKESNVSFATLKPRIITLLYPFMIWTVIRYMLLRSFPASLDDLLNPYHFIPILIQFYFLAPVLVPLARNHWRLLLVGAAVLQLGIQALRYAADVGAVFPGMNTLLRLSPRWLFYGQQPFWFPFGLVFGLHSQPINERLKQLQGKLLFITLLFAAVGIAEYLIADYLNGDVWIGPTFSGFTRNFYILAFLLFVLSGNEKILPNSKTVSNIGAQSLGIYLANIPFIYVVAVLMYRFIPVALSSQLVYQSVLIVVGLAGPLLLMQVVRRSRLRFSYRYLFG